MLSLFFVSLYYSRFCGNSHTLVQDHVLEMICKLHQRNATSMNIIWWNYLKKTHTQNENPKTVSLIDGRGQNWSIEISRWKHTYVPVVDIRSMFQRHQFVFLSQLHKIWLFPYYFQLTQYQEDIIYKKSKNNVDRFSLRYGTVRYGTEICVRYRTAQYQS